MADTQAPQRSLWLQVVWKPVFRSRREKLFYHSVSFVSVFVILYPALYFGWLDAVLTRVMYGIGVLILYAAGALIWLTRGRKRFPLPAPDESQSTA